MLSSVSNLSSGLNIQGVTKVASNIETESPSGLTVSALGGGDSGSSKVGGTQPAAAAESPDVVKQLKKQIEQLQKQLQQQQQVLQKIQSSNQSAEAKAAAVAAAQVQMTGISAALQTATSALLQAVTAQGGESSGSMITATA